MGANGRVGVGAGAENATTVVVGARVKGALAGPRQPLASKNAYSSNNTNVPAPVKGIGLSKTRVGEPRRMKGATAAVAEIRQPLAPKNAYPTNNANIPAPTKTTALSKTRLGEPRRLKGSTVASSELRQPLGPKASFPSSSDNVSLPALAKGNSSSKASLDEPRALKSTEEDVDVDVDIIEEDETDSYSGSDEYLDDADEEEDEEEEDAVDYDQDNPFLLSPRLERAAQRKIAEVRRRFEAAHPSINLLAGMSADGPDGVDTMEDDEHEDEEEDGEEEGSREGEDDAPKRRRKAKSNRESEVTRFHVGLDADDLKDTSMVAEYAAEIFGYMSRCEVQTMPNPSYMEHQSEIEWSMRQTLVDWLLQVHMRYHMLPETLWIAINLVDRFLSVRVVSLVKLQLVGVTAMFIAAKYEEILAPSVDEFVFMTENGYTKDEILKGERIILQTLDFNISIYCSPYSWVRRVSKADDYDIQTRTLCKFLTEVTLLDHRFLQAKPSLIAAVGMYLSKRMLGGEWDDAFIYYSCHMPEQLLPGAHVLLENLIQPGFESQFVYKKYANKKFLKASIFARDWALRHFRNGVIVE